MVECDAPTSMDRRRRTDLELDGVMEAAAIAGSLGRELRTAARRRRLTQAQLGLRVGMSGARIGELERGKGANAPLTVWVKLGKAIGQPLAVSFSRDVTPHEPRDAGHLAAQELVLALGRQHGRRADFELPSRPTDPARSIDIALRDDHSRAIIVVEIWNRLDDLGAAARSTTRKASEVDGLAVLAAADGPSYRVATCWLFVDTASNRRLVARYPRILQSRFPGSSVGWVRCLSEGRPPPSEPGLAWIDLRSGRLVPLRHRGPLHTDPARSAPEFRR
jgi:transcriptional regulator with XRE-family HTH domain